MAQQAVEVVLPNAAKALDGTDNVMVLGRWQFQHFWPTSSFNCSDPQKIAEAALRDRL